MPFAHAPVLRLMLHTLPALLAMWVGACGSVVAAPAPAPLQIVYPLSSGVDSRYDYDWAVLRMALEKTEPRFGPFVLRQSGVAMSPPRIERELQMVAGRIDIMVRATSAGMERMFVPVRLPVDRGLLGYRVFLVRAADLPRFAAVRSVADLAAFKAGQGRGWVDVPILNAAGITTVEGSTYDGLFAMLDVGRFDFFSRSADEASREYGERHAAHPQLAIEPTLLLHYPLPRYFFLRRSAAGEDLARRIAAGMEIMIRDGSLNALFVQHKAELIERTRLNARRVLTIPNPALTPQTPLSRAELWYNPLGGK